MSAEVLIKTKAKDYDVSLSLPQRCVYCGGGLDAHIQLKLGILTFDLGDYSFELADKYGLPWVSAVSFGGFTVSGMKSGWRNRHWQIECAFKVDVPYCKEHVALKEEIERSGPPGKWAVLGLAGMALGACLGVVGILVLLPASRWFTINTMVIFLMIMMVPTLVGTGLAYLMYWLFGPKGPEQRKDYFRDCFKGDTWGLGSLGCRFIVEQSRSQVEFLQNPYVVVRCTFTNEEYAKAVKQKLRQSCL